MEKPNTALQPVVSIAWNSTDFTIKDKIYEALNDNIKEKQQNEALFERPKSSIKKLEKIIRLYKLS